MSHQLEEFCTAANRENRLLALEAATAVAASLVRPNDKFHEPSVNLACEVAVGLLVRLGLFKVPPEAK